MYKCPGGDLNPRSNVPKAEAMTNTPRCRDLDLNSYFALLFSLELLSIWVLFVFDAMNRRRILQIWKPFKHFFVFFLNGRFQFQKTIYLFCSFFWNLAQACHCFQFTFLNLSRLKCLKASVDHITYISKKYKFILH
jgi:hypothetical protein